jgi:hypothetical protein
MSKPLTDTQLARRKRISAHTTQAGSAAGLTSLGLLGASVATHRGGQAARALKLRNASLSTGVVASGVGGFSGFNNARIQTEEARRRQPVIKFGEKIGARYTVETLKAGDKVKGKGGKMYRLRAIAGEAAKSLATDPSPLAHAATRPAQAFAKAAEFPNMGTGYNPRQRLEHAGTPQAPRKAKPFVVKPRKQYDPEAQRRRRQKAYTPLLAAGAAGSAGYAGQRAGSAVVRDRKALRAVVSGNAAQHSRGAQEKKGAGRILRNLDAFEPKSRGGKSVHARSRITAADTTMPKNRAAAKGAISELRSATRPFKVAGKALTKRPGATGLAAAGALGAAAVVNEHHRNRGGKTYNGWWEHRY